MTTLNNESKVSDNKLPTVLELQEMIKEMAVYCDALKEEITILRSDLELHEHGKGGVLIPVRR